MSITELPPEEWARVDQARQAALTEVLVTGISRDDFTAAAATCYAAIGHPAPLVLVAPSPLIALAWSAMLRSGQLHGQLYGQLHDQLGGQLRGQLGGQLGDQLYGQLGDQLYGQLYGQLDDQLRGVHWSGWRQAWLSHWLHVNTLPGITPAPPGLAATMVAYRTFCVPAFTIPLTGVVIGLGPHLECKFDATRRLHNQDGPAWSWPDGGAVWAWHGTRVPEWVIADPTVGKIAAETNTEIRRCAIENLGWATYLEHLGVAPVSVEPDPGNPGFDLSLYDVPDARELFGGDVRLLVMHNASRDRDGTRRTFAETVPATCGTAIEAAAWQFDIDPDIYRAIQRAT